MAVKLWPEGILPQPPREYMSLSHTKRRTTWRANVSIGNWPERKHYNNQICMYLKIGSPSLEVPHPIRCLSAVGRGHKSTYARIQHSSSACWLQTDSHPSSSFHCSEAYRYHELHLAFNSISTSSDLLLWSMCFLRYGSALLLRSAAESYYFPPGHSPSCHCVRLALITPSQSIVCVTASYWMNLPGWICLLAASITRLNKNNVLYRKSIFIHYALNLWMPSHPPIWLMHIISFICGHSDYYNLRIIYGDLQGSFELHALWLQCFELSKWFWQA
jgi:hypothetical protein